MKTQEKRNNNDEIFEAIKGSLEIDIKFLFHGKMQWDNPTNSDTRDVYLVTLKDKNGRKCEILYGQCIAESSNQNSKPKKKPTFADVLYSIERNDPETFDDFCSNFGYDNDSIKDHKIYMEVQKQYQFMRSLPCIDKINDILQDY